MDVYSILKELSATSSKNEKIAILTKYASSNLLKKVLKFALCPYIQYNIKRLPKYVHSDSPSITLDAAIDLVELNLVKKAITGTHAKLDFLLELLSNMSEHESYVLCRIIMKDLRVGVAEGTVNKVFKGLIPPWPCLLAESYNSKTISRIKFPAFCQLKSDGTRINIIVADGVVSYYGRSGKEFDFKGVHDAYFIQLASVLNLPSGVVFDGECLVMNSQASGVIKRETGNGIISKALKDSILLEEAKLIFFDLWDVVSYDDFKAAKSIIPYSVRFDTLKLAIDAVPNNCYRLIETTIVHTLTDAFAIYEMYLAAGCEGAVLKNFNTIWEDKRSKDQIKLKAELECEVIVKSVNLGNGKYEGLIGSLACETADGVIVDVSGFTDEFRAQPFDDVIGKIITVRYNAITEDAKSGIKSLFLPRFVELRHDKTEPDSILNKK